MVIFGESMVQLRCKFTLTREQFTRTLEQFTQARIESLVACALLPARNSCKIIRRSSGVVSDKVTHVNWHRSL